MGQDASPPYTLPTCNAAIFQISILHSYLDTFRQYLCYSQLKHIASYDIISFLVHFLFFFNFQREERVTTITSFLNKILKVEASRFVRRKLLSSLAKLGNFKAAAAAAMALCLTSVVSGSM